MPRSPSRDLADRFTGNRGYFHRPESLERVKYALAGLLGVAAVAWGAFDLARPGQAVPAHSHGPLAGPHAAFEDDCAVCHRSHSVSEVGLRSVFRVRDRWHDLTCDRCHNGPTHHLTIDAAGHGFHERCSNCHHEHGGRGNSLRRMSDDHCTRCHSNLTANHVAGTPEFAANVGNFATSHPEFRALLEHPPGKPLESRTLKFSHAVHMTPGQTHAPGGKEAMTPRRLRVLSGSPAAERYRTPGQADDAPITLDCASCHRLEGNVRTADVDALKVALAKTGEPTRALLPARTDGAYYLPINFESHCQACHPLRSPAGTNAGKVIAGFDLPHRLQPNDLRAELTAGYVRSLVAAEHPALALPQEPGGRLDPRPDDPARVIRAEADRLGANALGHITTGAGCGKCHDVTGEQPPARRIAPVADRTVWFTHARFDHSAHRGVTCASCHPGTSGPAQPGVLVEKEPIQILGVDSCRACHSPARTPVVLPDGSKVRGGGVRHACSDCHNYHGRDHPVQGRGGPARQPVQPLTLPEFLREKRE